MVKPLNFAVIDAIVSQYTWAVVFAKPLGSKLHRVHKLPNYLTPEEEKELSDVLNTICLRKHKDVWYFKFDDAEDEQITADTLAEMNLLALMASPAPGALN
jgi:hypothetical protein